MEGVCTYGRDMYLRKVCAPIYERDMYSLPLLHSTIYYLVKEGWYHIFIIIK